MRKEDWVVGKYYRFVRESAFYSNGNFTMGSYYKLVGEIDFYDDDNEETVDWNLADALFVDDDGDVMHQDLRCFDTEKTNGL